MNQIEFFKQLSYEQLFLIGFLVGGLFYYPIWCVIKVIVRDIIFHSFFDPLFCYYAERNHYVNEYRINEKLILRLKDFDKKCEDGSAMEFTLGLQNTIYKLQDDIEKLKHSGGK